MNSNGQHAELLHLLDELCESKLDENGYARIEELIRGDREALTVYLHFVDLNGSLHWNAGQCGLAAEEITNRGAAIESKQNEHQSCGLDKPNVEFAESQDVAVAVGFATSSNERAESMTSSGVVLRDELSASNVASSARQKQKRRALVSIAAAACLAIIAVLVALGTGNGDDSIAETTPESPTLPSNNSGRSNEAKKHSAIGVVNAVELGPSAEAVTSKSTGKTIRSAKQQVTRPPEIVAEPPIREDLPIVEFIDAHIRAGWTSSEVTPSPRATDAEWIRRVHLQIVGHIPTAEVVEQFLADGSASKRQLIVDRLLDDTDHVRHASTVWTNLLVGRSTETVRTYDRPALKKFLREAFAYNRPWKDVVYDLVSAEGGTREQGATNFLVAHVNNQAVPATAIVSRVFLGTQIHCAQCHDHPFNDWKQTTFWELNSCFQQTEVVRSATNRTAEIVKRDVGGPVFFENRQGVLRAAYPSFAGQRIDPSASVDRRKRLAELMTQSTDMKLARATVNRVWSQFMGCGFTNPVDDMGPHNQPSHPSVIERLAKEFVQHNYDVKQLIRWITQTEAYQLTSRFGDDNSSDDPEAGYTPAFSRVYVKPLTPEQVYDSLLVATGVKRQLWDQLSATRESWLQQFVTAYETDENDESTDFAGTVTQALLLMNGDMTNLALEGHSGSVLAAVNAARVKETRKLELLCLAALSRSPTPQEEKAFTKFLRTPRPRNREEQIARLRDVFWAYLNSNEFVSVH